MRLVAVIVAAGLLLTTLMTGCREHGTSWDCTCSFLTDYDDASTHEVRVCSADAGRVEAEARGCAQAGAPAPVQGCSCGQVEPRRDCLVGACETRLH